MRWRANRVRRETQGVWCVLSFAAGIKWKSCCEQFFIGCKEGIQFVRFMLFNLMWKRSSRNSIIIGSRLKQTNDSEELQSSLRHFFPSFSSTCAVDWSTMMLIASAYFFIPCACELWRSAAFLLSTLQTLQTVCSRAPSSRDEKRAHCRGSKSESVAVTSCAHVQRYSKNKHVYSLEQKRLWPWIFSLFITVHLCLSNSPSWI